MLKLLLTFLAMATTTFLLHTLWPLILPGVVSPTLHRNEVVIITGSSSGIGAELALQYARAGAKVVVTARRAKELEKVVAQALASGASGAIAVQADFGVKEDCQRVVAEALRAFGGLDTVVFNHAMFDEGLYLDREGFEDTLLQQFKVNVVGVSHTLKAALPHLEASPRGGKVVEVSSGTTKIAAPFHPGYGTTKTALHGFIKHVANELFLLHSPVTFTTCILGMIGTPEVMVHKDLQAMAYPVEDTAREIIVAAQAGLREVHVPHWISFGTSLSFLDPSSTRFVERFFMNEMYTKKVPEYVAQLKVADRGGAGGKGGAQSDL